MDVFYLVDSALVMDLAILPSHQKRKGFQNSPIAPKPWRTHRVKLFAALGGCNPIYQNDLQEWWLDRRRRRVCGMSLPECVPGQSAIVECRIFTIIHKSKESGRWRRQSGMA
jgi:hypothetical protein